MTLEASHREACQRIGMTDDEIAEDWLLVQQELDAWYKDLDAHVATECEPPPYTGAIRCVDPYTVQPGTPMPSIYDEVA